MPTLTLRRILTAVFLLLPLQMAFAAGPADRIAGGNWSAKAAVPGSEHPLARPEFDRGAVQDDMPLSGLALNFQRSAAQQTALETLIEEQNDPSSTLYHQWLTPEQFATRFGMSAQDIATAKAWLTSQGFNVVKVSDSGNAILFTGTAGQVHSALGTEIHHYQVKGVMHYANASAVTLPAALAAAVSGVSGLNDFHPAPQVVRSPVGKASTASPLFTSGISGNHYLTPGDFSTIYDVTALTGAGYTGTGETIGIVGQTDIVLSDITAFRAAASLPANNPTVLLIPGSGDPGFSYTDLPEADLDLEWSGGIAPNANIVFLNSTDAFGSGVYGIENRVTVNGHSILIPIISFSYGGCETDIGTTALNTMEAAFQQAATQGQTVVAASGDTGAADCDSGTPAHPVTIASHGLAVDYPASSAYVTGIGGTEFNDGSGVGATAYWSGDFSGSASTDVVNSAISYIPEEGWDDTPDTALSEEYGGILSSGGGASVEFSKPSWQTGIPGIPNDGSRDVPDIAFNASPVHDSYLVCTQIQLASTLAENSSQYTGSCGNGFRISDGTAADNNDLTAYGGTSLGAPSFAGILALMLQKIGGPQGSINAALYTIASNATKYASDFHDVKSGSNQVPCSTGNGCLNGVVGYTAGTGYDQVTGLGSVDANNLATDFVNYVISNGGKIGTTVALTYLPTIPTIGQSTTFTATVTPNSGNSTPTGSVTFSVDGIAVGSTVTLVGGVASTSYSFSTGGSHTVIASYSGDSSDYASISPTTTISNFANAPGALATTTVLSDNNVTTATLYTNSAPTFTATVTAASGTVAGTVTFTVGGVSTTVNVVSGAVGVGTASFTPSAVTAATGFTSPSTSVTASYSGSTDFQQSSSNTIMLTVGNPSFTITANTITVQPSSTSAAATETVTITALNGFNDPVQLTLTDVNFPGCGSLSAGTVYPTSSTPATVTLTVGNNNCGVASLTPLEIHPRSGVVSAGFGAGHTNLARETGILLTIFCMAGVLYNRKRRLPRLVAMLAIVLLGGLLAGTTGCGNYAPGSGGNSNSSGDLTAGTYQITISGTDLNNSLVPTVSTTVNIVVP